MRRAAVRSHADAKGLVGRERTCKVILFGVGVLLFAVYVVRASCFTSTGRILKTVGCWPMSRVDELAELFMRTGVGGDASRRPQTAASPGLPVREQRTQRRRPRAPHGSTRWLDRPYST